MYKYETHLHTLPVSKCAEATVRENLELYKEMGYEGVFITNHFLDGNINANSWMDYKEKLDFYFSDYETAKSIADEIGIKVFLGVELSYKGTDFLVYGLDKSWYLAHPEIMDMKKSKELALMMDCGALVIHAHPFREADYIDHIRLFPRAVHGVEVVNACRTDFENQMAKEYSKNYNLLEFAGTDNHFGRKQKKFAGMMCDEPILNEHDFIKKVKAGKMKVFYDEK